MTADAQPPAIDSPAWADELRATFGLEVEHVRALLDLATGRGRVADPHEISMSPRRALERLAGSDPSTTRLRAALSDDALEVPLMAAAWVLFHERHPVYAAMMYLRMHAWQGALEDDVRTRSWIVRQFAAMILHGADAVRDSAWYSLCVDYFEDWREAERVLPPLTRLLGEDYYDELASSTTHAIWSSKRELFERLRERPELYPELARALIAACDSGFLRSVEIGEARVLASSLEIDEALRAELAEAMRAERVVELLVVGYDERRIVVSFAPSRVPSWFIGCEVYLGDRLLGRVLRFRTLSLGPAKAEWRGTFLQPPGEPHLPSPTPSGAGIVQADEIEQRYSSQCHEVSGDRAAWQAAVGRSVRLCGVAEAGASEPADE